MRNKFRQRMMQLTKADLRNPNLVKMDKKQADNSFKKMIEFMVLNLEMQHAQPEEVIIMQSDKIVDIDGTFDEDAYFYVILKGIFKVSTLRFNKHKSKEQIE